VSYVVGKDRAKSAEEPTELQAADADDALRGKAGAGKVSALLAELFPPLDAGLREGYSYLEVFGTSGNSVEP